MKTRIPGLSAVALGLLMGGVAVAVAQEPVHTESTVKTTGAGPTTKTKMEWVNGTVKEYEAGKKIKVEGPGEKSYSFDLDENAHVQGSIVVGQKAKVGYTKSADGVEHVSVISEASAASERDAAAPRMHTESVVKHTGPGPNTRTKTETVVGTVKEYTEGKSIKVTGPGDKNYSFDLNEGSGVEGSVTIGERVQVTYSRMADGDKVTTIKPYHGK